MDRIHQEIAFNATPSRVFEALTDSAQFSQMSGGAPTEIDASAGGAFSCFGGMIHGRILECLPGERLVQAWRAKNWEPGVYSVVRFEMTRDPSGTRLTMDHAGFPEGQGQHLEQGWHANYWEPLRKLLT